MKKVKISEITMDMIRENIQMGRIRSAVDDIIKKSKEIDTFDYCDFESFRSINLLRISLKDEYDIAFEEVFEPYKLYDEIVNKKFVLSDDKTISLSKYIEDNVFNYHIFDAVLYSTKDRIEKQFDNNGQLEQIVGGFVDKLTVTLDKVSDKKYVNSIIKTAITNIPKELKDSFTQIKNKDKQ